MFVNKLLILTLLINYCSKNEAVKVDLPKERFRGKIVSLLDCGALPEKALDKTNFVEHHMSAYKIDRQRTLIRANISIPKKFGPVYVKVITYEVLSNSIKNKVYELTNISCTSQIFTTVVNLLHINYTSNCQALPGNYSFDDFDIDAFSNRIFLLWRPGRYAFQVAFYTPDGIVACIDLVVDYTMKYANRRTKIPMKNGQLDRQVQLRDIKY